MDRHLSTRTGVRGAAEQGLPGRAHAHDGPYHDRCVSGLMMSSIVNFEMAATKVPLDRLGSQHENVASAIEQACKIRTHC